MSNLSTCNINDINVTIQNVTIQTAHVCMLYKLRAVCIVSFAMLQGSAKKLQLIHELVPQLRANIYSSTFFTGCGDDFCE